MKRRSRAGGEASKARGRKALKPKRRDVSKTASSPAPIQDAEVAQLTHALNEALERETATSDVLQVISRSSGDLEPLFATILEKAVRICDAAFGNIYRWDSDAFYLIATHKTPPAFAEARRRSPYRLPNPKTPLGRMVATKTVIHVADLAADQGYIEQHIPEYLAALELGGVRTVLAVPMLKDDELIGGFTLSRQEVRPFTDKQIELVKNFGNQAVIAIENARLLNELRRRTTDLSEALEQQTATSEVLQVVSSSPGDLEPVFATMLEKAVRICGASFGNVQRWDGETLQLVASHNTPRAFAQARRSARYRPDPELYLSRVLTTKTVVHITDAASDKGYLEKRNPYFVAAVELGGVRTALLVPMLKENEPIGVFSLYRQEVRPFTDKQIALVTNFAAQAVIAIENARLLNELRQRTTDLTDRTSELTEALEQQTATSEVLQVISSSPGDLQPVFATILENATRICEANFGNVYLWDGDAFHLVAAHNTPRAFADARERAPFRPNIGHPFRSLAETKQVFHVADIKTLPIYQEGDPQIVEAVELGKMRTCLGVPMLKDNNLIGAVLVFRQEVRQFTANQIALITNFAAQAVIAIENARLLNELRQSLEQQTATADVLKVISRSTFDLQTVLETLVASAASLCAADKSAIWQRDGELLRLWAANAVTHEAVQYATEHPLQVGRNNAAGRAALEGKAAHILDVLADTEYSATSLRDAAGYRTVLAVPLLRGGVVIGVFALTRQEVRPFSEKQIELVTTFADQAVIAIENARLLNELRQTLEQQTATAQVLQVISSSTGDLARVFATMLENATRICEAKFGTLYLKEGDGFRATATHNAPPAYEEARAQIVHPSPHTTLWQAANTKRPVQIADVTLEQGYSEGDPFVISAVKLGGYRSALSVPLLHENEVVGVISIFRQEAGSFSDEQVSLLQNFAAQAVIAIENAHLLSDLQERTLELSALNEQLEHRVADQVGEIERMGRLRRFLPPQVADLIVASGSERQLESHRREITALFCDLRGFTGFTESADAEDVMALLRDYHAAIGELVIRYSGTLERYAGDGVMVVFNDPVPVENPALQAVLMALELRNALGALTQTWSRLGHEIGFGIGIAHGFATLGTIGYEGRFDYAAIGTVSNVASRLCDEAKPGQILISPRVLMKVEDAVKVEPVGEFELKGIRRPLAAYNVVGAQSSET
jgi:GAF domain-containing protein